MLWIMDDPERGREQFKFKLLDFEVKLPARRAGLAGHAPVKEIFDLKFGICI
jgi:hypothetical protein